MTAPTPQAIEVELLRLCAARGPAKTCCPSEVARALRPGDWRVLMPAVRAAAAQLADRGRLSVLQGGQPVDARSARGPIRLQLVQPDND